MRGLMFRSWKIAAIAAGPPDKEWQTRRAIKPTYQDWQGHYWYGKSQGYHLQFNDFTLTEIAKHARYRPGEVVYIKEAWATERQYNHLAPRDIPQTAKIFYVADGVGEWPVNLSIGKLRSPIFLMEWMARLFIKILTVEACRTRDITPEDCEAEGITSSVPHHIIYTWVESQEWYETPQQAFFALYDSINGKGAHEYGRVWCYQFVKTARPEVGK